MVLLRDKASRTLPLAQIVYFNENTAELNLAFAFFIMAMLPILILYFSLQRYVVSGVLAGAVKGYGSSAFSLRPTGWGAALFIQKIPVE